MKSAHAHAIDADDMHIEVECPECSEQMYVVGYVFTNEDEIGCIRCDKRFQVSRIWIDEDNYAVHR